MTKRPRALRLASSVAFVLFLASIWQAGKAQAPAPASGSSGGAGAGGGGVTSINTVPGAFTFSGSGVNCVTTTCTFNGGGAKLRVPLTFSSYTNTPMTGSYTVCGNVGQAGTPSQIVIIGDVAGSGTITFNGVARSSYTGPSSAITTLGTETLTSALNLLDSSPGWGAIAANTVICLTLTVTSPGPSVLTVEVTF